MLFWVVTPCGLIERYHHFGETYCFQGHFFPFSLSLLSLPLLSVAVPLPGLYPISSQSLDHVLNCTFSSLSSWSLKEPHILPLCTPS